MTNVNMKRATRAQRRKIASIMRRQRKMWNSVPTMIHEDDYKITDCVLCGKTMPSIHDTHAAYPLKPYQTAKQANADGNTGRCCSACQGAVLRARVATPFFADAHSKAFDEAVSQQAKSTATPRQ